MDDLPTYLEARERELLAEIKVIGEEIAELHGRLAPLETELSAIRRCKATVSHAPTNALAEIARHLSRSFDAETERATFRGIIPGVSTLTAAATGSDKLISRLSGTGAISYTDLTMKELVVKALSEHFLNTGAPTRSLIQHFKDAWGRDIARTNLSPQISRLYQEGTIGRIRSSRGWFLYVRNGIVQGFRPYLHQGRIAWCEPQMTNLDYEPLVAKEIEPEVAKDRMPYKRSSWELPENGRGGLIRQSSPRLVWLLPDEITSHDAPALRHEFPAPDNEED
jgi:hypothetical protein